MNKEAKEKYGKERQAAWGDPIQGSIAKQEAEKGFEAGYRQCSSDNWLENTLSAIGTAHANSEKEIHIKEGETFVKEATEKIKQQAKRLTELTSALEGFCALSNGLSMIFRMPEDAGYDLDYAKKYAEKLYDHQCEVEEKLK